MLYPYVVSWGVTANGVLLFLIGFFIAGPDSVLGGASVSVDYPTIGACPRTPALTHDHAHTEIHTHTHVNTRNTHTHTWIRFHSLSLSLSQIHTRTPHAHPTPNTRALWCPPNSVSVGSFRVTISGAATQDACERAGKTHLLTTACGRAKLGVALESVLYGVILTSLCPSVVILTLATTSVRSLTCRECIRERPVDKSCVCMCRWGDELC